MIRPSLFEKISSYDPQFEIQLTNHFINGTLTDEFINSLRYEIPELEITRYYYPNLEFDILFNYNHTVVLESVESFTRAAVHEFKHIHYFLEYFYDALKWSLIRDACKDLVNFADENSGIGCSGCSKGPGHEKHNPENCFVCNE